MLLLVVVVGPIAEELLFRGVIYGGLRTCFPVDVSALVSALIFGIYHKNIVQGLYAAAFGIILAYIFEKTQSIWGSTLMHMAFNLSSYLISGIGQWFAYRQIRIASIWYVIFMYFALWLWRQAFIRCAGCRTDMMKLEKGMEMWKDENFCKIR